MIASKSTVRAKKPKRCFGPNRNWLKPQRWLTRPRLMYRYENHGSCVLQCLRSTTRRRKFKTALSRRPPYQSRNSRTPSVSDSTAHERRFSSSSMSFRLSWRKSIARCTRLMPMKPPRGAKHRLGDVIAAGYSRGTTASRNGQMTSRHIPDG
jgi:hypothetical protein